MFDLGSFEWPQYLYLAMNLVSFGYILANGTVKVTAKNALVGWVPTLVVLSFGGFFGG